VSLAVVHQGAAKTTNGSFSQSERASLLVKSRGPASVLTVVCVWSLDSDDVQGSSSMCRTCSKQASKPRDGMRLCEQGDGSTGIV